VKSHHVAATGAVLGLVAVAAGAFGTHSLRGTVEEASLSAFETGARYQMYHALALLGVGLALDRWPSGWLEAAGLLFVAGIALFSGSLYLFAFTGIPIFGFVAAIGGVAFLAGWACMAAGFVRGARR
jgi:uncharacterized membrane protein YgdD (TMEM256/DUF423 family)